MGGSCEIRAACASERAALGIVVETSPAVARQYLAWALRTRGGMNDMSNQENTAKIDKPTLQYREALHGGRRQFEI